MGLLKKWETEAGFRWIIKEGCDIPHPSVTSVIGCVVEPWLKDYFKNVPKKIQDMKLTGACNRGNQVHDLVYDILKGKTPIVPGHFSKSFISFKKWLTKQGKCDIIYNEIPVQHPDYYYGGSIDLIMQVGDKVEMWDIKSGNKSVKTAWQLGGYKLAYEAMGLGKIDRLRPVYLTVEQGSFGSAPIIHNDFCERVFLETLDVWKAMNHTILSGKIAENKQIHDPDDYNKIYKWPDDKLYMSCYQDHITKDRT